MTGDGEAVSQAGDWGEVEETLSHLLIRPRLVKSALHGGGETFRWVW